MLKKHLKDFISLIFPNTCLNCNMSLVEGEEILCLRCFSDLPLTNYHLVKPNPVLEYYSTNLKVSDAFSFLKFESKGIAQKLLHQLKYKGYTDVGIKLGEWFAKHLNEEMAKAKVDFIVPNPLHRDKKRKRGFNQTEFIAIGMSHVLVIPVRSDMLIRTRNVSTQTKKEKVDRWKNMESLYKIIDPEKCRGKRILLIDDVITTGATIGAAAEVIAQSEVESIIIGCIATGK